MPKFNVKVNMSLETEIDTSEHADEFQDQDMDPANKADVHDWIKEHLESDVTVFGDPSINLIEVKVAK